MYLPLFVLIKYYYLLILNYTFRYRYLKTPSAHPMYPGSQLYCGQSFRILLSGWRYVSDHCRMARQRVQTLFQELSEFLFSINTKRNKNKYFIR